VGLRAGKDQVELQVWRLRCAAAGEIPGVDVVGAEEGEGAEGGGEGLEVGWSAGEGGALGGEEGWLGGDGAEEGDAAASLVCFGG
jgi:hypothetical protein